MIWSRLKQKAWQLKSLLVVAGTVSSITILGSFTAAYEPFELSILDWWFRLRSPEKRESRIVVVNIGESDIRELGEWPISDGKLADLLKIIAEHQPRAIGLDIYRDIPHGDIEGQKRLTNFFESAENIVGVEKAIGERIYAPSVLKRSGKTAMADLVLDRDGKVRRALVSTRTADDQIILGLATKLALMYLTEEEIRLEVAGNGQDRLLGKARFSSIAKNEGGYANADVGGYQTMLNWRGDKDKFAYTSLKEVLNRQIPPDLFEDKIVIIGSTAPSLNDFFYTPLSGKDVEEQQMPGAYVHANIASQIISAAIDNRPIISGFSQPIEWSWIVLWSFSGAAISLVLLEADSLKNNSFISLKSVLIGVVIPVGAILGTSYSLFLSGIWLPALAPLIGFTASAIATTGYYNQNQKNLAFTDGLTQVANRRFFDRYLENQFWRGYKENKDIAMILCDVDFFKKYNDTYGHQGGDECLQKVAEAIRDSVRPNDLPARYGGEEFAVILPNTDLQTAVLVAHKIRFTLKEMQIPHQASEVSSFVSISCGVSSIKTSKVISPEELIAVADRALYLAKEQGRDSVGVIETKKQE